MTLLFACSKSVQEKKVIRMTDSEIIDILQSKHILESATFYTENRNRYESLDSLYFDYVIPYIEDLTYYEYLDLQKVLDGTPAGEYLKPHIDDARDLLLQEIADEIFESHDQLKELFVNEIVPAMRLELDSIIEKDFTKTMNKYSGGFMNIRKLTFIAGRNEYDFIKIWKEVYQRQNYDDFIDLHTSAFLDSLRQAEEAYYCNITGKNIVLPSLNYDIPKYNMSLPEDVKSTISTYTKKEKNDIIVSGIRDFVIPMALSGGWALVYDLGTLAYDVKQIIDDIESGKLDAETIIIYDVCEKINERYLSDYMAQYRDCILSKIDESGNNLYQLIEDNL